MQSGDGFVIFLIVLLLCAWLYFSIRAKMRETVEKESPLDYIADEEVPDDDATRLMEDEGYRVLCGKRRIPIDIEVNAEEELHSRLFIDYMVEKKGKYYAVKLAKERKPLEMTGSAIRERLLIYQLLYPQTAGVLYVDSSADRIDRFVFTIDLMEGE